MFLHPLKIFVAFFVGTEGFVFLVEGRFFPEAIGDIGQVAQSAGYMSFEHMSIEVLLFSVTNCFDEVFKNIDLSTIRQWILDSF